MLKQKLVLDVDTGVDDALALLYACASPEADLLAVTCCAGNVEVELVAENTLGVLNLAGRSDVEVAVGSSAPWSRPLETTPLTHGIRGIGYADLPSYSTRPSGRTASELLIEEANAHPGEITVVALGPLTNLAHAVADEPKFPTLLRDLVIMGGAFRAGGNIAPRTEWNVHVDPEATKVVYDAWKAAPPLVVGLDVTELAQLMPQHVAALRRAIGDPAASDQTVMTDGSRNPVMQFVIDALRYYMEFHNKFDGFYGAHIHDPFTVAAALDQALITWTETVVDVELAGTMTTGETVADWRGTWQRPPNARVATSGRGRTFLGRFIQRLAALMSV